MCSESSCHHERILGELDRSQWSILIRLRIYAYMCISDVNAYVHAYADTWLWMYECRMFDKGAYKAYGNETSRWLSSNGHLTPITLTKDSVWTKYFGEMAWIFRLPQPTYGRHVLNLPVIVILETPLSYRGEGGLRPKILLFCYCYRYIRQRLQWWRNGRSVSAGRDCICSWV